MDKKTNRIRKTVQSVFGILQNGYFKGFIDKTIYKGSLKHFCVPGMNCYSCPGALGACPIGALQALFDGRKRRAGLYVIGFLMFLGMLAGRFVCGWLCLFGLIQELLYKIPTPKPKIPEKADRILRYAKYVFLLLFVIALPLLWRDKTGMGEPFFCKYICPVGTLEGGIPLVLLSDGFKNAIGLLFKWKVFLLILIITLSVFIYRPFCKYICPLGAFYALFQKISLLRL
ncbi:MAG: 4Fe-4S binding protein, partial [Firmicutes bacterium]|nr:4Fe-4S binding protein [Bacillota bacterium]